MDEQWLDEVVDHIATVNFEAIMVDFDSSDVQGAIDALRDILHDEFDMSNVDDGELAFILVNIGYYQESEVTDFIKFVK